MSNVLVNFICQIITSVKLDLELGMEHRRVFASIRASIQLAVTYVRAILDM